MKDFIMKHFVTKHLDGKFCFVLTLLLDRVTKFWAGSRLALGRGEGTLVSLGLHFNRGISFSLLESYPHIGLAVTLTAMGLLGIFCAKSKTVRSMPGMALLWAGAAGNLTDRLLYGHVVDWIYIFTSCVNLADIWLCAGGLFVLVHCAKKFR
jgi:signal peptidase II